MSRRRPIAPTRRGLLRGALGGLALPFLHSALPRSAWARTPSGADCPRRLVYWYVPNGMQMDWWTPTAEGAGYDLPAVLEPLAGVQPDVSVLTGLSQEAGFDGRPGDHARGTGCFLTATTVRFTAGDDIENGISCDQVAAQALGDATVFPSLQLGIEGGSSIGDCDSGYSCAYSRNISWAGPSTPLPSLTDPILLFERLFGANNEGLSPEEQVRQTLLRASVLDFVREEASLLKGRLGVVDGRKLDEYLSGVRELELRVQALGSGICEPGLEPGPDAELPESVRLMTDLTVQALECDLTRVVTFMMGNAGSYRGHPHLGIAEGHHDLSHHGGDADKLDKLVTVARWEVEEFAYLVQRLGEVAEADGSRLLDHSLAFFSSEIEDGDTHNHRNMPVLLAGSGGGAVTPGRHLVYGAGEPIADLFIAMLDAFGVEVDTFGLDGTGPLAGLT
ncbi:MAG: hypothetical protein ACI8PZ_002394 [Myxococcota bacterium]